MVAIDTSSHLDRFRWSFHQYCSWIKLHQDEPHVHVAVNCTVRVFAPRAGMILAAAVQVNKHVQYATDLLLILSHTKERKKGLHFNFFAN